MSEELESINPAQTEAANLDRLGQVYTPDDIADFMAAWLEFEPGEPVRLLDPGAGGGVLTERVIDHFLAVGDSEFEADLVERDRSSSEALVHDIKGWRKGSATLHVHNDDFLDFATGQGRARYTHIVMNPPYVRIGSADAASRVLHSRGIKVPNLYAAFMWLSLDLLVNGGQLVAIVPRSFFNGSTFKSFRSHLLTNATITHLHSFQSRGGVFNRDRVLQETVILRIVKGIGHPEEVAVSWSRGESPDESVVSRSVPFREVVGADGVLRVPDQHESVVAGDDWVPLVRGDLEVSTGSVVDFRVSRLAAEGGPGRVLLVDSNYGSLSARSNRSIRYLIREAETEKYIFPVGNYVVVKRVSPKEQEPRLRAALVARDDLLDGGGVAFENHVNVFHRNRMGLSSQEAAQILEDLARPEVEAQFRHRSGTTQVNLGDLRSLLVPPPDGERYANPTIAQ